MNTLRSATAPWPDELPETGPPHGLVTMHILMVIIGGTVLLGVLRLFGRLWGADLSALAPAATFFFPVWLAVAVVNMYIGVTRAGYTVMDELPILGLNFAVPAAIAVIVIWQFAKG
jgi:hypothetical protein